MRKYKRSLRIFSTIGIAMMLGGFLGIGGLANSQEVQAAPSPVSPVTYNLYATDGWWTMADGRTIYSYGFIGGQQGATIHPLNNDGSQLGGDSGIAVPAPTAGPVTAEQALLQGHAQFPAPLITCTTGQVVTITLKNLGVVNPTDPNGIIAPNAPNDPHTIHLHGLDVDVANDGVPETSVAAIPANDTTLTGYGNVVVYMFSPKVAGTYFYHCHQEADIHVDMGMYGALIVYNPTDEGVANGPGHKGTLNGWNYDKDYVLLLSDTDVRQHLSETQTAPPGVYDDIQFSGDFNPVAYQPQYWFINGLSFPNTIHAGLAAPFTWEHWIAAHPGYDPMITGSVSGKEKILIRMINMGFETQPMHIHGFHLKVLGKDQRAWFWANSTGTPKIPVVNPGGKSLPITIPATAQFPSGVGLEVNTLTIGSGEEYDLLLDMSTQATTSTYDAGTYSRYDTGDKSPQLNTATQYDPIKEAGVGPNTYIGGPTVAGAVGLGGNSQIFVFHNHDDYKATNNGAYPGGMFTVVVPQ